MDGYFAVSGCGWRPARRAGLSEGERAPGVLRAELDEAARVLALDGDQAALLLDGVLRQIAACWYARHGVWEPDAGDQLADLDQRNAPFGWRLRLALRAPDPAARLEHARQLLRALDGGDAAHAPYPDEVNAPHEARKARAAG
jgi:hypothetical protein